MELNVYLNFPGTTEAAFTRYREVFGGEFDSFIRFGDTPAGDQMPEEARGKVLHASLLVGGTRLMATDHLPGISPGELTDGNAVTPSLHPDSREEADRIYAALAEGGEASAPMADMFWGDYWGVVVDRFGLRWMIDVAGEAS
jgi:PhnB protein